MALSRWMHQRKAAAAAKTVVGDPRFSALLEIDAAVASRAGARIGSVSDAGTPIGKKVSAPKCSKRRRQAGGAPMIAAGMIGDDAEQQGARRMER